MQTQQPQQPLKLSPSLTILKFLVIAMGITMIVGFLFLLGIIYRTIDKEKRNECIATAITLPERVSIGSIATAKESHQLHLLLEHEDGSQSIATVDNCNGELLNELKAVHAPAR